jgi:hypothetical protein
MKATEYLVFAALLTPTLVVVLAAVVSLTTPEAAPDYHSPVAMAASSGAGLYPAVTTDE